MNLIGGGALSVDAGASWKAIGTGDFTGAGDCDIVFQNTSTGQVAIWEMHGMNVVGGGLVGADPGPSWRAIGTDGGGSDILFQSTSGQTSIWDMSGTSIVGGGAVSLNAGPSWKAIGMAGDSAILFKTRAAKPRSESRTNGVGGDALGYSPGSSCEAIG